MDITLNGREHAVSFDDTPVALVATIYASGDSTQRFAIVDRCPNGAVVWDGLGEGFDYDGICVAGDCSTYGESIEYTLIPGDTLTVETSIFPGGSECTSPLAPGVYTISGHLPLVEDQETSVCSNSVQLSIQE
jgi:hypothetical protein